MKFYSCKVRLAGSVLNEVPKLNITAPEVIILRNKHGDDAVAELKETKVDKVGNAAERERLSNLYGEAIVEKLFGAAHRNLPQAVYAESAEDEDGDEPDAAPLAPVKPKSKTASAAA